jgi:NAD-dependent SIR2 family protein deacetylase
MVRAVPNDGHRALTALEAAGSMSFLITQNVDGLHEEAGSRSMCALHGRIAEVVCLGCRCVTSRAALHTRLDALNPGWSRRHADVEVRPDGDVELASTSGFVVPGCQTCGGVLKPDVVFFGGTVGEATMTEAWSLLGAAGALLVVGSSLAVYSGFRFARRAHELGLPVALVNEGPTRADDLAEVRLAARAGDVLPQLAAALGVRTDLPAKAARP